MPITPLSEVEARVLGSLIEKEATTPDNYPLSLNALVLACNQSSNRDPVMALDENTVKWAVNSLRQQSLVRAIQPADSRVMKFQHLAGDKLEVDQPALALLCVLLLRGPQTLGELRTRTARLGEFATLADVDAAVNALVARDLAVELPRRPGQKEVRFAQLLSGAPAAPSAAEPMSPEPVPDRIGELEQQIGQLRAELTDLRSQFEEFRKQFG